MHFELRAKARGVQGYFAHAKDDLNLQILHVFKGTSRKHAYIMLTPLNPTFM